MKNTSAFVCLFLLSVSFIHSQPPADSKRDNIWVLRNGLFDFASSPPAVSTFVPVIPTQDRSASICDTAGNLLFYTNGFKVANRNHQLMENGDSLSCCQGYFQQGMQTGYGTYQGALALPVPGETKLYYVLTANTGITGNAPHFLYTSAIYYSVVDMAQAGGLGRVVQKNVPLIEDSLSGGMLNACRHANGRDWWVLVREYGSNHYHRFWVSPSGIVERGTQAVGDPVPQHTCGQTVFSPDGNYFATVAVTPSAPVGYTNVHHSVYGFDRCTGLLSDPVAGGVEDTTLWAGIAFSPSSRFLYISSARNLWQYDMQDPDWEADGQLVGQLDGWQDSAGNGYSLGMMQLAPDNKIYMYGGNGGMYLNVIAEPDSPGIACNFQPHSLTLTTYNSRSMPYFPHFRLGALAGSGCDTLQQVGLPAATEAEPIKIYPNPASNTLRISRTGGMEQPSVRLEIRDMYGKTVLGQSLPGPQTGWEIQTGSLPAGIYTATIRHGGLGILHTEKIIIVR